MDKYKLRLKCNLKLLCTAPNTECMKQEFDIF